MWKIEYTLSKQKKIKIVKEDKIIKMFSWSMIMNSYTMQNWQQMSVTNTLHLNKYEIIIVNNGEQNSQPLCWK